MGIQARKIVFVGLVQGVGFRPHIYRLATTIGLKGYIKNMGGNEVEVWIEGTEDKLNKFINEIKTNPPIHAQIENIIVEKTVPKGYKDFTIDKSSPTRMNKAMIPPDLSICDECIKEVHNPLSRFYEYPFHSCVNCGPRYSMLYNPPYDRENTSMRDFPMCEYCKNEYRDPRNIRRFHAQGISCPNCGPKLRLLDNKMREISVKNPLKEVAGLIDKGFIIAVKGIGGYHIASLATRDDVLQELRRRKKRGTKPFALMALNIETVQKHAILNEVSRKALLSQEKPIIILPKKESSTVSQYVAPGLKTIGIMLPYTALHYLLLEKTRDKILVMTSANITGEPMCTTLECIEKKLGNIIDYVLDHNRIIVNRVDDSVMRLTLDKPIFIRRSRGYAPKWIRITNRTERPVIALGGFLSNTGAVAFDNKVVLTPYIGDLDSYTAIKDLFTIINKFIEWYDLKENPIVVIDKHPLYPQRRLWKKYLKVNNPEIIEIQHHYAHALQVIAENKNVLEKNYTVITIDGTGYGDDGNILGGEILYIKSKRYTRIAHLKYQPYIGGDESIKYPARFLLGYLYNTLKDTEETLRIYRRYVGSRAPLGKTNDPETYLRILERQQDKMLLTSSIGRVLDAFSVLLGYSYKTEYDGEPAIKLEENTLQGKIIEEIQPKLLYNNDTLIIDTSYLLEKVIDALEKGYPYEDIGYSIQWSLGYSLGKAAVKGAVGDQFIYVSGGAAVNHIILSGIEKAVTESCKKLVLPMKTPPGDGGLSFGQAVYGVINS